MISHRAVGELLIKSGVVSAQQLEKAAEESTRRGVGVEDVLVESGALSERQLADVFCEQLGLEYVDISGLVVSAKLSSAVPGSIAIRYGVAPVRVGENELWLAMKNPLDFIAVEEVRALSHRRVVPVVCTRTALERAIDVMYGSDGLVGAIAELESVDAENEEPAPKPAESTLDGSAPAIRVVNLLIERAADERASDIHFEPREGGLYIRIRIDGVLQNWFVLSREVASPVTTRLKVIGGMNIAERRLPQDGHASVTVRSEKIDLRISALPTIHGEKVVVRLLRDMGELLAKENIGLTNDDLVKYDELLKRRSGMILIAGPTGSGKSSTMYSMIREMNTTGVNIVTLEDPVEYNIDGVNQVQINDKTGLTFAVGLRAVLRQDPDIICIGEIRDGETASIAMRAAVTGHLVLSTVHTNDAASAVERLMDIGVEPYMISAALKGVMSQRLVRRICPACRAEYLPEKGGVEEGFDPPAPNGRFYRGTGCRECFGTGYRGRTGVFEIAASSGRNLLRTESGEFRFTEQYTTLVENCRRLVREGVTTVHEALRVIGSAGE